MRNPRRAMAALLCATIAMVPASAQAPAAPAAPALETTPVPGKARLEGRILGSDGKTPRPGAVIRVCSLETDKQVASAVADAKGEFHVDGLNQGFVEIVVTDGEQAFAGNQVVQLSPTEHKAFELVLVSSAEAPGAAAAAGKTPRPSPCSERPPTGSAEIQPKSTSGQFLHSKKGIAIVAGTGAALLLLLASGGGSGEAPASPSSP